MLKGSFVVQRMWIWSIAVLSTDTLHFGSILFLSWKCHFLIGSQNSRTNYKKKIHKILSVTISAVVYLTTTGWRKYLLSLLAKSLKFSRGYEVYKYIILIGRSFVRTLVCFKHLNCDHAELCGYYRHCNIFTCGKALGIFYFYLTKYTLPG